MIRSWMDDALCAQTDPELFFPEGVPTREAIRTCRACPVSVQCLEEALRWPDSQGVWAATTEADRKRMRAGLEVRERAVSERRRSQSTPRRPPTTPEQVGRVRMKGMVDEAIANGDYSEAEILHAHSKYTHGASSEWVRVGEAIYKRTGRARRRARAAA